MNQSAREPLPTHISLRAQHETRANEPVWPFKRFGPGQGGQGALQRAESLHPWRPYKDVWADLGLQELWDTKKGRDPWAADAADVDPLKMATTRITLSQREGAEEPPAHDIYAMEEYELFATGRRFGKGSRSSSAKKRAMRDEKPAWIWGKGRCTEES